MTAERDIRFAVNASDTTIGDPAREADEEAAPDSTKSGNYIGWLAVTAMACGLLLGLLLAQSFGIGNDVRAGGGSLFAGGALAQALSDEMSGSQGIGPSFWSKDGYFCRAFDTGKGQRPGLDGIACREGGDWRIHIVTSATGAAQAPASVRSTMNSLIVGSPLDAAAERQARRQGWRPG